MKKSLFRQEFKAIFTKKKFLISMIAILFIPIMYCGVYLWAFWDPYSHLDRLPVAIVNEDKGAEMEGEELHLGDDLVDKLKENDKFDFHFVNRDKGYKGLEREKYYMLIEIPGNFSENATTLMDEKPKKLTLKYVPNQGYNFISSQIGDTAMKDIKAELSKEVTKTYAESIFDNIKKLGNGLEDASEGSKKLDDGAHKVSDGAEKLKQNLEMLAGKSVEFTTGVSKLKSGADELAKGTDSLAAGLGKLSEGHSQLLKGAKDAQAGSEKLAQGAERSQAGLQKADDSMGQIVAGSNQLSAGADSLAENLKKLEAGAGQTSNGAKQLETGISTLQEQLSALMPMLPEDQKAKLQGALAQLEAGSKSLSAGTNQLQGSAGQLSTGASTIADKMKQLNAGQQQLKSGLDQLSAGSGQLAKGANDLASGQSKLVEGMGVFGSKLNEAKNGADKLAQGAGQLAGGMNQLSSGSNQLTDGAQKLANGSKDLSKGSNDLSEGTKKLHDKLEEGANDANSVKADENTYDMMGEPVKVNKNEYNKVPNYGTGFAPYFISLSLFVGALVLSIIFPLREPAERPRNGFSWFIGKFGVVGIVGIIQSLIVDAILLYGLDLKVESIPLFVVATIVASITFISIIQFLVTALGDPGRFIGIIVLILQLTTSAGTYPLETIPKALQPIHYLLPMSYSVQAFKAVISSGDFAYMWTNLNMLFIYIAGFLLLSLIYFLIAFRRKFKNGTMEEAAE
ncbi:YhgE/Pip family protein [Falsibacillus pallidus]|uniref:YhgE/Pip family protein n=1 Tax=Falsibacillus pallidus TaxID=493781 RepID=UPI003D9736B9